MKYVFAILVTFWMHQSLAQKKLISLAPHTTEMVFALGKGHQLVAVSDFSDYPEEAKNLPSIASHNGVNFEQILRLQPDLILAWKDGNKPQDLARLASMGFTLFYSSPQTLEDIGTEILALGKALDANDAADTLNKEYLKKLADLRSRFQKNSYTRGFYYMWPKPLMSIGQGAWANQLLEVCGIANVFEDAPTAYPQVTIEQVTTKQPELLIAAMKVTREDAETFWTPWRTLIKAPVKVVNPDLLHRFTPRILSGIEQLCSQLD